MMNSSSASARRRILLGMAAFALVGAACSSDGDGESSSDTGSDSTTASTPPTETTEASGGEPSGDPFHVVIIADLSGPASALTGPAGVGMQTAFEAINDEGGAAGHPIEVTVFDGQSTAAGAQTAMQQALAEDPDVIAPALLSSNLAGVIPLLQPANIPVVSGVSIPDLVNPAAPAPWYFAMGSYQPQSAYGYLLGLQQVMGDLDGVRIGTVATDTPGSQAVIAVLKLLTEEEGAEVVRQEIIPISGFTSFTSQATSLVADGVDVVVTVGRSSDVSIIGPALRTAGFEGPLFGGEGSADDALFESLQDPQFFAGRVYGTPQPGDHISETAARYNRSTEGTQFESGWAQAYVIAAGLDACGFPCDQAGFTAALEGMDSLEIPGEPSFTPLGFGPNKHFALTSNQFVVWDPEEEAIVPAGPPVDVSDVSEVPTP